MNKKLPLLAGRDVLHPSLTKIGATRWLMKNLSDTSLALVRHHGFTLNVFPRTDLHVELNGGAHGWVYSICK